MIDMGLYRKQTFFTRYSFDSVASPVYSTILTQNSKYSTVYNPACCDTNAAFSYFRYFLSYFHRRFCGSVLSVGSPCFGQRHAKVFSLGRDGDDAGGLF